MARRNRLRRPPRKSSGKIGRNILLTFLVVIVAGMGTAAFILFETEKPQINLNQELSYINQKQSLAFTANDNKSGLRTIKVTVVQDNKENVLLEKDFERQSWFGQAGPDTFQETANLDIKKAGLTDGKALLVIEARDFSLNSVLKGNTAIHKKEVLVDTKPPRIGIKHSQMYIQPGGSGIVTYELSEEVNKHGVAVDDLFFPGFPLAAKQNRFIAYIALPWNSEKPKISKVIALDEAGNEGKAIFSMHFKPAKEKHDRINIGDSFLERKIPEFEGYYPEMEGSQLDKFLFVNNKVRKLNYEKIKKVVANTSPEKLWQDSFVRMPGAGKAGFADQRTYYYNGEVIDHQTHLGMDIASTAHARVPAANTGKVIFADYLGIYGNTVVLDHGQGVASLYSHLSSIDVSINQMVNKDDVLGRSGLTGMAGGDHLHFSMLINGIFVMPIEWWDQHWIEVNINDFIGS